jgi:outer membrane protein TolC
MIKGRLKIEILMLSLLFITISVRSQDTLYITIDSAINHAIEYNLQLKNAELKIEESEKFIRESTAIGLPQVNASADYSNFMGAEIQISFAEDAPPTVIPFEPTSNLQLSVGQLLFSGNYVVGLQIAKLYKSSVVTMYEKSRQDIIEEVTKSYYMILVAENSKEIVQSSLENINDIYQKTEGLVNGGMLEKTDADQLSVQVTMLDNALKSAERQIELAYNMLRFYLGVDVNTPISLRQGLDEIMDNINFETTLIYPFMLENNLDYQLMLTREVMLKKQVTLEKMNYLPTLSGFYQHTEKLITPAFDMSPADVIGVKATIPIFSSGMRKAKVAQAKIRFETGLNNKELLETSLLLQEKQLRFNLTTALDQFESQKKNVEVSNNVYNSITLKYEQGMVSSLDLTTANSNYLKSETDYITALIRLLEAEIALQKLYSNL